MQWNIYMNLYIFKNNMGRMHDFWNFLILRLRHVNTINSLQWLWSWFVKAYAPTDEGSKNLKISKICASSFQLDFGCKFAKIYCKLDVMLCIHWKACMNVVQNAPTVNLLHFGYQYCGK